VGGPATSNNALIPEMIAFCRETATPIDFISTHHYPTDVVLGYGVEDSLNFADLMPKEQDDPGDTWEAASKRFEVFNRELWKRVERGVVTEMTRRAVQEAQGLPVYYTEWNSLAGLPSDGPFGSSFIAKTVMDNMGLVKGYSYWTFSDIFEEGGMPGAAFHGGFGLMTLQGVPKASYRAFQLLHMLGGRMYPGAYREGTLDAYALRCEETDAVQVLAVNHQSLQHPIEAQTLRLRLKGLGDRREAQAERYRVDEEHANALRAWKELGSPETLDEGQLHTLHAAGALKRETFTVPVSDGEAELNLELPPMGTALVTVYL
jgi:xylan 1,4-beta-xylosidase